MKKIKTLFKRDFTNPCKAYDEYEDGCEWVANGEGIATVKIDGTCCAIINGVLYKRYDAKDGKTPPENFIFVDKTERHYIGWIPVNYADKGNIYIARAHCTSMNISGGLPDGTYEAIGHKINNNPYDIKDNLLVRHGEYVIADCPRTYEGLKEYLQNHYIEGIVFHRQNDTNDMCKIKRTDFGFSWNGSCFKQNFDSES